MLWKFFHNNMIWFLKTELVTIMVNRAGGSLCVAESSWNAALNLVEESIIKLVIFIASIACIHAIQTNAAAAKENANRNEKDHVQPKNYSIVWLIVGNCSNVKKCTCGKYLQRSDNTCCCIFRVRHLFNEEVGNAIRFKICVYAVYDALPLISF